LLPIDDPRSGTGRYRRYDLTALYCTTIFNVLANDQSLATLIGIGRLIRNLCDRTTGFCETILERWQQALTQRVVIFLIRAEGHRGGGDLTTGGHFLLSTQIQR
jgi:hypothetical protein